MLRNKLLCVSLLPVYLFISPIMVMTDSAKAGEVTEVGSVTATVLSGEVRRGDPNVDEGEPRNISHFPDHPELYVPIPLPEVEDFVESSIQDEGDWTSYDMRTGEEILCEDSIVESELPVTLRSKGGMGLNPESQVSTGRLLNFSDLTWVDNTEEYPWSVNCKLYLETILGTAQCSGVLIDPLHVLTAGHCVYNDDFGGWPIGIDVVPGYEDSFRPYGDASITNLHAPTEWINDRNLDFDMGIITLDRPIGAIAGWHGYSYNNDDSFFLNNIFNNPGYPAEFPYDGEFMYYWYGNYDYIFNAYQIGFFQRGYRGQSGSCSYYFDGISNRWVYAVLSNGSESWTNHVRITPDKFTNISDIIASNTPLTLDLIPLFVWPSPLTINAGDEFFSLEYLVHNYSYAAWSGTVNVGVYLSDDSNISPADTLIQNHNFTWDFEPKSTVLVGVPPAPTIPADTNEGFYWIGVILDIADFNVENNESDGQDAALIYVMPSSDLDNDNIPNDEDNCPSVYNPDQDDTSPPGGNGIGDACECEGNFNCDDDCDGSDAFDFKVDFGRSVIGNPCETGNTCNGDFDCDGDCDGTDAFKFKEDFGRSGFNNPCPACIQGDWCVYP